MFGRTPTALSGAGAAGGARLSLVSKRCGFRVNLMLGAQTTGTSVYDRFGNRWQQNPSGFLATFNGNNNRIDGYTYDAAGNLLSDGTNHYTYDAENRLISYSNTAGAAASYVYDALGQRVEKTSNTPNECSASGTVFYIRDLSGHVAVYTVSGVNQCHDEIFAGGRHLVTYEGRATFNHSDWLGTERLRIVSAYVSLPKYDEPYTSYPFGDALTGNLAPPYGGVLHFTGQPHDLESNLEYFGARYFSSSMGRFTSPDPLLNSGRPWDPQSWNRYSYVRNNPLTNIDPTGLYDLNNTCASDNKKCNKEFRQHADQLKNGLKNLQNQLKNVKDPVQKARLEKALGAIGTEGDHNGVTVGFGATKGGGAGETTPVNDPVTYKETYKVTLDPSMLKGENDYAVAGAHEGTHIDDIGSELANPSLGVLSDFSLEYRGYQTSIFAASALGGSGFSANYDGKSYQLWNGSWAQVDKNVTNFVTKFHDQNGKQTHPETTQHNPWPN